VGRGGVRLMGRSAAGVKGIELADGNEVVGFVRIPMDGVSADTGGETSAEMNERNLCLLTITENGYGKRTPVDEYRVQAEDGTTRSQSRGGKGRKDIDTGSRNGRAVAALAVCDGDDVAVMTREGQLVRMPSAAIRQTGRGAQGVRVVRLNEGDQVVSATRVVEAEDEADVEGEAASS